MGDFLSFPLQEFETADPENPSPGSPGNPRGLFEPRVRGERPIDPAPDPCDDPSVSLKQKAALGCFDLKRTEEDDDSGTTATDSDRCSLSVPDPATWTNSCYDNPENMYEECGNPLCPFCTMSDGEIADARKSLDITTNIPGLLSPVAEDWLEDLVDLFGESNFLGWETETALIEMAWAYLVENMEILIWAACLTDQADPLFEPGDEPLSVCLIRKLTPPGKVDISVSEWHFCEIKALMCTFIDPTFAFQEVIHIPRQEWWYCMLDLFEVSPKCAAISLAGILLHELFHACRENRWGDSVGDGDPCFPAYTLEAAWNWAMFSFCDGAADQEECADMAQDSFLETIPTPPCNSVL